MPLLGPVLAWLARATDAAAKYADAAQRALEAERAAWGLDRDVGGSTPSLRSG